MIGRYEEVANRFFQWVLWFWNATVPRHNFKPKIRFAFAAGEDFNKRYIEFPFRTDAALLFSIFCKHPKMKRRDFLQKWGLSKLKMNAKFLEAEFSPKDPDREAAWDLYVELLTRATTQCLPPEHGDEKAALDSVYAVFPLTREILRRHGSGCGEFAKLAIPALNQIIRPFTAKWHRLSISGAFNDKAKCEEFRDNLAALQPYLRSYTTALAAMAAVEDLTWLEQS